jgi:hypothetical protein
MFKTLANAWKIVDLRKKLLTTQDGLKTLLIDYSCVDNFFDTAYGSTLKEYVTEGLEYFIPIYADALNDLKDAAAAMADQYNSDEMKIALASGDPEKI